ncbi:hypothetical protein ACETK8_16855 [Brevundimonas staleyi]|uniref:Uncharacterized protein n=1 Tax=Brevundimonas staleyi TaxID=74326 RepID=A0ABW0FW11_9CAUL
MAEATNDLIYEVLKSIQARLDRMDMTMGEVKGELQAIRQHQLATSQEVGNIYVKLGRHDDQLNRIETRLGLLDPAH